MTVCFYEQGCYNRKLVRGEDMCMLNISPNKVWNKDKDNRQSNNLYFVLFKLKHDTIHFIKSSAKFDIQDVPGSGKLHSTYHNMFTNTWFSFCILHIKVGLRHQEQTILYTQGKYATLDIYCMWHLSQWQASATASGGRPLQSVANKSPMKA